MAKTQTPVITVVICSYNTRSLTCECLDRLYESAKQLSQPVEVVVVENGSDGTGEKIRAEYRRVKLITPRNNTGYARGNNLGMAAADKKSRYLLLLNSDTLMEKDTLFLALKFFSHHPDCAVLGCQLKFPDGRIQPSAGYLPTPLNTLLWMSGLDKLPGIRDLSRPVHPGYRNFFRTSRGVEWVMGAFLMIRKEVYEKTSGFDENYFMYGEEVEWCRRISDAGFHTWYSPEFSVTHMDKASSGGDIKKGIVREIQGLEHYMNKYYPDSMSWLKWVIKSGMLIRALAFFILGNRYRAAVHREAAAAI